MGGLTSEVRAIMSIRAIDNVHVGECTRDEVIKSRSNRCRHNLARSLGGCVDTSGHELCRHLLGAFGTSEQGSRVSLSTKTGNVRTVASALLSLLHAELKG
jgi:hypothetical protein